MELREELKQLIIDSLALEEITPSDIKDDDRFLTKGWGLTQLMLWNLAWLLSVSMILLWNLTKKKIKSISIQLVRLQILWSQK